MAAKRPKAYIGKILLPMQDANAPADVREVTNMALAAFLKVYVSRLMISVYIDLILCEPIQKSWKTKTSSAPIPMIRMRTEMWIVEKYFTPIM